MSYLGSLQVFDHKSQDWEIFSDRVEQFIKLNGIKDEQKSAVILTYVSEETYRLIHDLSHPKKVKDLTYEELINVLREHFKPVRSTFADKAKFYEASRAEGESVEDWAARLRGLAVYCGFDSALDTVLRDRFVLGFNVGPERDRLFEQDSKKLTFAKAVQVAKQAASARAARSMTTAAALLVKEEPMYRIEGPSRSYYGGGRAAAAATPARVELDRRCTICGLRNHEENSCKYKNYRCQKCGTKGHLKKVCKEKKCSVHNIESYDEEESDSNRECKECKVFNMRSGGGTVTE